MWCYYRIGNDNSGVVMKDVLSITARFNGYKEVDYSAFTTQYDAVMLMILSDAVTKLLKDTAHELDLPLSSVADVFNNYLYMDEHMAIKASEKEKLIND